ncbi:gluconokinase [Dactylosporangium sp. NPDC005555]|uniref:gluconokinase n=1 Tax=Dactylosporangium sp. NPDC005555 TaxID=3154889 RepID=UPI0033ABB1D7
MPDTPPPVIVVMGVAGTGKTTVGALLAGRLGWRYAEADDFHPAGNVAKMAAGEPLTDEDRAPWLAAIGRWIDEHAAAGSPGVVSCSGLRRVYRDQLRAGRPQVRLVLLDGSRELITRRLAARHGHFMRVEMLDSQLAALEPPQPDEDVTEVSIDATPEQIVDEIMRLERLGTADDAGASAGN